MGNESSQAGAALHKLIRALHDSGRLRVWSLVITVFGDAVVPRGGRVGLALLQEVMARLGIEAGALRTAMSRLAADGWVVREKSGRNSFYELSQSGRHAFDAAMGRIYAAGPPAWGGNWTVAVAPGEGDEVDIGGLEEAGFVKAGERTWLRPELGRGGLPAGIAEGMLVLTGQAVSTPREPHRFWQLGETAASYRRFLAKFTALKQALEHGGLEPLDAFAARTLLVHDWRRIVLRDPCLPQRLLPDDWPGEKARRLATDIYASLAAASEAWLDEREMPAQRDPTRFAGRFGIFSVAESVAEVGEG